MGRERNWRLAIAGFAVIGIGVSIYLTVVDASGGTPICAAGSTGCSTVADSEYSELGGVPVPVLGIVGYALLLASAGIAGDLGRIGGMFLGIVGFGFSAYLTYLELFVIEAVCQWCVVSALLMTAILLTTTVRALRFAGTDLGPGDGGAAASEREPMASGS
ncbi:MAG: vitamin K epoxide reductase family protein [Solirubrobacterales bacterium]